MHDLEIEISYRFGHLAAHHVEKDSDKAKVFLLKVLHGVCVYFNIVTYISCAILHPAARFGWQTRRQLFWLRALTVAEPRTVAVLLRVAFTKHTASSIVKTADVDHVHAYQAYVICYSESQLLCVRINVEQESELILKFGGTFTFS